MSCRESLINLAAVVSLGLLPAANAEPLILTVDQAVERAFNTDPRISEKEKLVTVARGLLEEAQGAESWIFDVNTFLGLSPDVKGGIFEDTEGNIKIDAEAFDFSGVSPWYSLTFEIIYPFSTLGKSESYADAAANNIKIQSSEVQLQRARTYSDVVRAYYGYVAAQDASAMFEDARKRVESAIELVEQWIESGEGNVKQRDLFALQTGLGLLKRYHAEAGALQNIAYAGLKLLTGLANDVQLELADKRVEAVPLPQQSLKELQQQAMEQRPEMNQVEAGLNARRALLNAKHAEKYPNFYTGVVGSISYSPSRPKLDNVSIFDPFNHAGATPIVGMKWDWWSGRQSAQVTQAQGEYDALIEKKSLAQIGIPFEVEEQYHQVHAHHKMVEEMYNAARASRRWFLSSLADFEAGVEESDKVLGAFQGYILAYTDYVKVVNNYNLHVARLRVVTGEIK
ncbi:MAG: TolC family protein [Gammaproteobacteria bacterium]|nr:TolC family protein [Gammaproteobacteria bacterium]